MARLFDGSTGYMVTTAPKVLTYPLTISVWVNLLSTASNRFPMMLVTANTGNFDNFAIRFHSSDTRFRLRVDSTAEGGSFDAVSTTAISANTWYNVVARVFSATDRRCRVNNSGEGTNATNCTPTNINRLFYGVHTEEGNVIAYSNVRIGEAAIWNATLDDGEMTALANRVSAARVRPSALIHYHDMQGRQHGRERDLGIGRSPVSVNGGATYYPHPPIYGARSELNLDAVT